MSTFSDLYRGGTSIDFRPLWRVTVPVSAVLLVLSIALLGFRGLNLSIDFEGGGVWEVPVGEDVTVADGRDAVSDLAEARVQLVEDPSRGTFIRVQSGTADIDRSPEIVADLAELGGVSPDEVSVSTVGPTWGDQITNKALQALLLFFVAVAVYLAVALEWRMAVGALIAVLHDLLLTAGVYALFAFEVSPATIIALLTILGYSLYDTVVVFDKVRENRDTPVADGVSHTELINRSMNQVLMRSINTTITTVLPVSSMLVIGGVFLGGGSLRGFALALFIGLILGTYSSIFLAAPVLAWLKEREPVTDEDRRRQQRAAEDFGDLTGGAPKRPASGSAAERAAAGGVQARPRKKKRRR
ncbi:MAG: protein translocase subunit SecF [Actinomycetota bacterium]